MTVYLPRSEWGLLVLVFPIDKGSRIKYSVLWGTGRRTRRKDNERLAFGG